MGHISSKNQAYHQARLARDVPAMAGSGETGIVMNLLNLMKESQESSPNSVITGKQTHEKSVSEVKYRKNPNRLW